MANSVRTFVIESLKGFYERLPLKKVAVDGSVLTPDASGVVNIPAVDYMTYITYEELKNLRDTGSLVPGMQYHITDYQCTTTQEDTSSAGHQFDIIVTADSSNVLNENARAIQHNGDTYFSNSNLKAWELKYCLENDTNRFAWADSTNGKGVIYYMKDEWNNECPYDFKNIMFLRGQEWRDEHSGIGLAIFGNCEEEYFYTFSCYDTENLQFGDATICQGGECSCFCNSIKIMKGENGVIISSRNLSAYLNNIVFFNDYGTLRPYSCFSNSFETNCYGNTFGNNCFNNSFGDTCFNNTFLDNCSNNLFGKFCFDNTIAASCNGNSFGNECYNNSFANNCNGNTFGGECQNNSFGNECKYNFLGDRCSYIKFGNSSSTKSCYRYIIVETGNQNIYLYTTQTTSGSNIIRNIKIAQGVNNSDTYKTITHTTVNDTHQTIYQPADSSIITV